MNFSRRFPLIVALAFALWPGACATTAQRAAAPRPITAGAVPFNPRAGHGEFLLLTLRSERGEVWRFLVDTGAPDTMLDRSLEPRLGPALGSEEANYGWFGRRNVSVYAAPKLFLGAIPLRTGEKVLTDDFQRLFPNRGILGILGMDCLRHYCVRLDFGKATLELMAPGQTIGPDPGCAYPIVSAGDAVFIRGNLLGAGSVDYRIDTGCTTDAVMETPLFNKAMHLQRPLERRRLRTPAGQYVQESIFGAGAFDGVHHRRLIVDQADDNLLGLRFLARHVVTLDFPRRTLYLRPR